MSSIIRTEERLWLIANVLTGFSVVQAMSLLFAVGRSDFRFDLDKSIAMQIILSCLIIIATWCQVRIVSWCHTKIIEIDEEKVALVTEIQNKLLQWRKECIFAFNVLSIYCLFMIKVNSGFRLLRFVFYNFICNIF